MLQFRAPLRALTALVVLLSTPAGAQAPGAAVPPNPNAAKFTFGVDWRLVRAGEVELKQTPSQDDVRLWTVGLVNSFFRVQDYYRTSLNAQGCATEMTADIQEGKKRREIRVVYDGAKKIAFYSDKDLVKSPPVVTTKETEILPCVYDPIAALARIRRSRMVPGETAELAISDGKRIVTAKVEAQERETLDTPFGKLNAIRYEAFLFNGVYYARKGRLFVWISDDEKRLPLRIRVQLPFYIGTVEVKLEKVDPS